MTIEISDTFMTISDLAVYLHIKPATLYANSQSGNIPSYKIGRLVRFKKQEIDDWLSEQKHSAVIKRRKSSNVCQKRSETPGHLDRLIQRGIDDVLRG